MEKKTASTNFPVDKPTMAHLYSRMRLSVGISALQCVKETPDPDNEMSTTLVPGHSENGKITRRGIRPWFTRDGGAGMGTDCKAEARNIPGDGNVTSVVVVKSL